jgi:hypothetical protein
MNQGHPPRGPRYGLAASGVAIAAAGVLVMLVFGRSASAAHWTGLVLLIAGVLILAAGSLRLILDMAERRLAAASAERAPTAPAHGTADRSPDGPERADPAELWRSRVVALVTCPLGVLVVTRRWPRMAGAARPPAGARPPPSRDPPDRATPQIGPPPERAPPVTAQPTSRP